MLNDCGDNETFYGLLYRLGGNWRVSFYRNPKTRTRAVQTWWKHFRNPMMTFEITARELVGRSTLMPTPVFDHTMPANRMQDIRLKKGERYI